MARERVVVVRVAVRRVVAGVEVGVGSVVTSSGAGGAGGGGSSWTLLHTAATNSTARHAPAIRTQRTAAAYGTVVVAAAMP